MNRQLAVGLALLITPAISGCLGDPPIEDRWTHLEIVEATPIDAEAYASGGSVPVTVRARITYRELLTGFVAVEAISLF